MSNSSHLSWLIYPNSVWRGLQIIKLVVMRFLPDSCYLFPRRPTYLPQDPILKHPDHMFYSWSERPSFTPFMKKMGKFYIFLYITYDKLNVINCCIINPLKPELNPICYLLALLGAHHFLHVSRIRVKLLTFRLRMSYIYIYMEHPFLMFLDHTQRRSTVGRTPLDE